MMEEVKQSRVHFEIAKRIVDKLADGDSQISQKSVFEVLKPILEDYIPSAKLKKYKIPERWFKNELTGKEDLLNELSSYLQITEFIETEDFINDLNYQ